MQEENKCSFRRPTAFASYFLLLLIAVTLLKISNNSCVLTNTFSNGLVLKPMMDLNLTSSNDLPQKYLIVDLLAGLTNQAQETWMALLIAEQLGRTLVLPRVRIKIPKDEIYANEKATQEPFDTVWDPKYFVQCARERLKRPDLVIATDSIHYEPEISKDDTYPFNRDNLPSLFSRNVPPTDQVSHMFNNKADYIKIVKPHSIQKDSTLCFRPSIKLKNKIDHYMSLLPENYSCLHARTESDWYSRQCCDGMGKHSDTTNVRPEEWTCSKWRPDRKIHTCYKTPTELVEILKQEIELNSTLWVASGSSREALQPLHDAFRVFTKDDSITDDSYMDYSLSEVDKVICSQANRFWGLKRSTFSAEVYDLIKMNGGNASWYTKGS